MPPADHIRFGMIFVNWYGKVSFKELVQLEYFALSLFPHHCQNTGLWNKSVLTCVHLSLSECVNGYSSP